jgi:hypothetical protein
VESTVSITFVAHIEGPNYSANFRQVIDDVIHRSRYFILLITTDTLERPEVIREVKQAYPTGRLTDVHSLVIFCEDLETIERTSEYFTAETGIDPSDINQHDFKRDTQLATSVINLCKRFFVRQVTASSTSTVLSNNLELLRNSNRSYTNSTYGNIMRPRHSFSEVILNGKYNFCTLDC